jgi:hypothetical protein
LMFKYLFASFACLTSTKHSLPKSGHRRHNFTWKSDKYTNTC